MTDFEAYRLTPQQKRAWRLGREPGASRFSVLIGMEGRASASLVWESLAHLARRHDILRTRLTVPSLRTKPVAAVAEEPDFLCQEVDLSRVPGEKALEPMLRSASVLPEGEGGGPLVAALFVRLGADRQALLLSLPEYCCDGWSLSRLHVALAECYGAVAGGRETPPSATVQYAQYAAWLESLIPEAEEATTFWKRRYEEAGCSPFPPTDRAEAFNPERWVVSATDFLQAYRSRADFADTPLERFLAVVWHLFLARIAGEEGTSLAIADHGRCFEELETVLGPFVRYLPFCLEWKADTRLGDGLKQFDTLWEEAAPWRDYHGLTENHEDLAYAFELETVPGPVHAGSMTFRWLDRWYGAAPFLIKLDAVLHADVLVFAVHYDAGRLARQTVADWTRCFQTLLDAGLRGPRTPALGLPLLDEAGRSAFLREAGSVSPPVSPFPVASFNAVADAHPRRPAVVYCDSGRGNSEAVLSFGELRDRADRLAGLLRSRGVGPETVVPLCFGRCGGAAVAMLGVLKAGGAYLPLEPRFPGARLRAMVGEAGSRLALVEDATASLLDGGGLKLISLDSAGACLDSEPPGPPPSPLSGSQAAYVLFTSGSTGKPKAVAVTHDNLRNYLAGLRARLPLDACSSYALVSTPAADLGNTVVYPALCLGGTLHLVAEDRLGDSGSFAEYMRRHRVDCLKITPSLLAVLLDGEDPAGALPARCLVLGGEATSRELVERIAGLRKDLKLFNHYGPTETTVGVLVHAYTGARNGETFPLGTPLAGSAVYLLNRLLEPVPARTPGDLFIGGQGVSRGYRGRPDLTAGRFVPDPFRPWPGTRMYRTGDRGRRGPDGLFRFLGRSDRQVKIRGYRIEPGEVETALARHPSVSAAAVVSRPLQTDSSGQALIAFLVPVTEDFREEAVREYLRKNLPDYMVPAALVALERLPTTANGKVDLQALRAMPFELPGGGSHTPPANSVERVLAAVWAEVLGLDQVGTTDTIFELGGHSLMLIMMNTRIRSIFGLELGIHQLFAKPTIREIAGHLIALEPRPGSMAGIAETFLGILAMEPEEKIRHLREMGGEASSEESGGITGAHNLKLLHGRTPEPRQATDAAIPPRPDAEDRPLSFDQQRLWLLDQLEGPGTAYNNPVAARFSGPLRVSVLNRCFNEIERRHEVLRTTIRADRGEPRQVVHPAGDRARPVVDLGGLAAALRDEELRRLREREAARPFDLEKGPVWRVTLVRLDAGHHVLLLTMHHICSDAWSMGLFIDEAAALYGRDSQESPAALKPLPIHYADYAYWQRQRFRGERLEAHASFWRDYLDGASFTPVLPTDRARPRLQTYGGASHAVRFPLKLTRALEEIGQGRGASLFMTLLTGFTLLLGKISGKRDLVVGTDLANRDRPETEPLIGFFINQLALRTRLDGNPELDTLIGRVRERTLAAFAHGELPFDQVVKALGVARDPGHAPLFQAKIFLQHQTETRAASDLEVGFLEPETVPARLDLTLGLWRGGNGLEGWLNYNTDLFDADTVAGWADQLRLILETMATAPRTRIEELNARLAASEKAEIQGVQHRLLKASLSKLMSGTSAPVRSASAGLVEWTGLEPGQSLPLVARPRSANLDPIDWIRHRRSELEERLHQHGAILFRCFSVDSVPVFNRFAKALISEIFTENAEHRPITEDGAVQVPVDYAADQHLLWHNENSFNLFWPSKILFACALPAETGGETPIVDSRLILERLRPEIKEPFLKKGLCYVRHYNKFMGLDWRTVFRTDSRSIVEARCTEADMEFEWLEDDRLVTRARRPAAAAHPVTGEWSWFNQAQHWHFSCLDPVTRASIASVYRPQEYPRNCYYGDGTPIEDAVMAEILSLYRELEVCFPWQKGDLLLLDNLLCAHARNPYTGPRKILVSMGDMRSFEACVAQ